MKVLMCFCAFLMFVASSLFAVQDLRQLPVSSPDELRQFALSMAKRGVRRVSVPSLDRSYPGITRTNVIGSGAEEILDKLCSADLFYRVLNTNDMVKGYIYVYDEFDYVLFYGYAQYPFTSIGKTTPVYSVWLMEVPVLSNVRNAEIIVRDENGLTLRRYGVRVDSHNRAMFDPAMAGYTNGILVATFTDGTTLTYDLSNPTSQTPANVTETAQYKIPGHYVVEGVSCPEGYNCTPIGPTRIRITEFFQRPTVFLKVPSNPQGQWFLFDVSGFVQQNGGYFERPRALVFLENGKESEPIPFDELNPTMLPFNSGNWRIRFIWDKFGKPGMIYTGPESGRSDSVPVFTSESESR